MTTSTTPNRPFFDGPDVGRALRRLRERAGLTQEALVDAINVDRPDDRRVHRTGLVRWERHGRIYFPDLLHLLAVFEVAIHSREDTERLRDNSGDTAPNDSPEQQALDLLLLLVSTLDQLQESPIDKLERLQRTVDRRFDELERQIANCTAYYFDP